MQKPSDRLIFGPGETCESKYPPTRPSENPFDNKDFALCFLLRWKILDEDYNVDLTNMGYMKGSNPKIDLQVDECVAKSALKKESLKETAYHLMQCILKIHWL